MQRWSHYSNTSFQTYHTIKWLAKKNPSEKSFPRHLYFFFHISHLSANFISPSLLPCLRRAATCTAIPVTECTWLGVSVKLSSHICPFHMWEKLSCNSDLAPTMCCKIVWLFFNFFYSQARWNSGVWRLPRWAEVNLAYTLMTEI